MNIAVILAAGKSKRMAGINKIFYKIKERPLIFYTLLIFEKNPQINKIILVARKKDFKKFSELVKKYNFKKVAKIVKGGKERQNSTFNALKATKALKAKSGDLILFHNGANPLVSQKEVFNVIEAAKKHKAALLAQPIKDTLKRATKNDFVSKTIDRKGLYSAQTPQVIEYKLAQKAFEKASKTKFYGTDDISLVERLKKRAKLVPCSYKNIKITFKEDLEIIKNLLINNGETK